MRSSTSRDWPRLLSAVQFWDTLNQREPERESDMTAAAQADRLQSVTLKSREDRKVEVPARDAEFLKLADQFVIEARQVAQDPKRRKPRLKFW